MRNEQQTVVTEVDVNGGWLIKHYTHTWDEYTPLNQLEEQLGAAQANADAAQKQVDEIKAQMETLNAEVLKASPSPMPVVVAPMK